MFRSTVALSIATAALAGNVHDRAYYEEKFVNWMAIHKVTPTDGANFIHMLQNFADNDDIIESSNAKGLSYKLGHNKFSHLTLDEFRRHVRLGLDRPTEAKATHVLSAPADKSKLASTIDWVAKGAVTGVKDQGQCGSCWSFSTTGALEGAYYNKYGTLKSFSEQNFVDCDNLIHGGRDHGCNGGLMDNAFSWAKKNGGVCSEADYPYTSGTTKDAGSCNTSCTKDAKVAPQGFTDVKANDDDAFVAALNVGPVSVAIEADQSAFQLYKSGVFTAACGANLDHGVLAVGYDADSYKVKNSWGESWGDAGFIYLARGTSYNSGAGQCGILTTASYPNL